MWIVDPLSAGARVASTVVFGGVVLVVGGAAYTFGRDWWERRMR